MGTLYVSEFAAGSAAGMQTVRQPPVTSQTVSIAGGSAVSAPFNSDTKIIRVHTDAICSIKVGINPVANTGEGRMAANQTEYFEVGPGQSIAATANL